MRGHLKTFLTFRCSLALLLVACALLLRVAIPAGWMPTTGEDGLVRITMCTGMGQVEAWVDENGQVHSKAPAKQDPKTDQPCAFAGLATAAIDATPAEPLAPAPALDRLTPHFADHAVTVGRGLAAPPPPPTGPPALA